MTKLAAVVVAATPSHLASWSEPWGVAPGRRWHVELTPYLARNAVASAETVITWPGPIVDPLGNLPWKSDVCGLNIIAVVIR